MIIVGLTGGIGSGKTTVAKEFKKLGIPIYIADDEAKKLMHKSKIIKRKLIQLFGSESYIDGELNRPFIANIIFNNKSYLDKMNAIIHPRVARHFEKWVLKQKSPYVIKEVAILFENGGDKACDYVITVTADMETRIQRLLNRDNTTKEKIQAIINNQLSDSEKIKKSHFVIKNTTLQSIKIQVEKIHKKLLNE
ncbi:dephospho-CoA kinase [Neotamlana laminarinivorans]|uniref:Dephospho-CoA kinase n=1 Tax=Neotamlana laminarinivorans TaxID=2883124 RepID=A0A9X1L070_9FLAO|nr:dephospho-CoA kinase [Tamlana laminarinivorans]MCB4797488.1 dephospho-CoA kinase [Tamlana laminarinivorans]